MGAFALLGLLLLIWSMKIRSGRTALAAALLFGVGVVGDHGGFGVFVLIGLGIIVGGLARLDGRVASLGLALVVLGIVGDTHHWLEDLR